MALEFGGMVPGSRDPFLRARNLPKGPKATPCADSWTPFNGFPSRNAGDDPRARIFNRGQRCPRHGWGLMSGWGMGSRSCWVRFIFSGAEVSF